MSNRFGPADTAALAAFLEAYTGHDPFARAAVAVFAPKPGRTWEERIAAGEIEVVKEFPDALRDVKVATPFGIKKEPETTVRVPVRGPGGRFLKKTLAQKHEEAKTAPPLRRRRVRPEKMEVAPEPEVLPPEELGDPPVALEGRPVTTLEASREAARAMRAQMAANDPEMARVLAERDRLRQARETPAPKVKLPSRKKP